MEILRSNTAYPKNRGTILAHGEGNWKVRLSSDFGFSNAELTIEINHLDHRFLVTLTQAEVTSLLNALSNHTKH
jgi:hypothetical protein